MEFQGIKTVSITILGLSQIYLNYDKIKAVENWFNPKNLDNFEPIPVRNFGNGNYTLTDGHTRTYVAYKNGVLFLPIVYDKDAIVSSDLGQTLYSADIEWCKRFQLTNIRDLEKRILDNSQYKKLWIERCNRSYHLLTQTSPDERMQLQSLMPDLFLYGACEDLSELFFENENGKLFLYKNDILQLDDLA